MSFKNKALSISMAVAIGASIGAPIANAAPPKVPESFTYNGGGWGHGVGMSQYGAYGMALEGKTAKQILEHYYNPAKLTNTTLKANSDIKVQLLSGVTTTSITPKDGQLRVKFGNQTHNSSTTVSFTNSGSNIKANINGKTYTVSGASGFTIEWQNTRYWDSGNKNTIVTIPKTNDGAGTGSFRHGKITVKQLKGKLNVVNSLRLNDEYLYGLAEVPSSWPTETLKAQAIAGRTYALRNMSNVKSACDCNVYDEVLSQKFTGWGKENEGNNGSIGKRWKSAVDRTITKTNGVPTAAQVVTYNGALIDALYSSTTGGKTRAAKSVWGYNHPYLQSRDDRWALKPEVKNPNASWAYTISQSKAARGYNLPDVKSISIKVSNEGTLISSTAKSSSGKTSTLSFSQTRSLFGAKSVWAKNIVGKGQTEGDSSYKPVGGDVDPIYTNVQSGVSYKTSSDLNMRSGAGTSFKVISVLKKDAIVKTTGKASGSWLQVKSGNATGWVSKSYLKAYTEPAKPNVDKTEKISYTTTANVHMRKGAGVSNSSIMILKKGSKVTGTGKTSGKWIEIKSGSKTGWVSSAYLKKASSSASNTKPSSPQTSTPPKVSKTSYKVLADLNVREKSSTNSKKLGLLKKGSKVDVYSVSGGWAKIKLNGKTAYVSSTYIAKDSGKHVAKVVTKKTTANVHIRSGAGTKNKSLVLMSKGKTVTLTNKKSGKWAQVKYGSKTGWVHSDYIK